MAEFRQELQLSVRALLYHIDHRRSHSELNQILPKVGSFEDWLKMRDPEDETGVRDCQIMLQAPPAEAGEEELQLWNEMARMSLPLFIKYKIDKYYIPKDDFTDGVVDCRRTLGICNFKHFR